MPDQVFDFAYLRCSAYHCVIVSSQQSTSNSTHFLQQPPSFHQCSATLRNILLFRALSSEPGTNVHIVWSLTRIDNLFRGFSLSSGVRLMSVLGQIELDG